METQLRNKIVWGVSVVIALLVVVVLWPFTIISAGERGIVLNLGKVDRVLTEGLHWVTPLTESVEKLDTRIQKEQVSVSAASKDLQTVSAAIALNYNLAPEKVGELWNKIGGDYKARIIDPAIQESVKAATANYTAEELITKRPQVKEGIRVSLAERLVKEFIVVDDVSITDFDFSGSFNQAIEAKVTAEQSALAQKNKLEQVKYEAEQRIAQATAEAKAIQIQAQAVTQQGGEDYVRLQAIQKWNGVLPAQFIPGMSVPFLNVIK